MTKDRAIDFIDRAQHERDFTYLTDLIRKSDLAPEVRDHLATVVLGLLTRRIKLPAHRPKREKTKWEAKQIAIEVLILHRYQGWEKLSAAVMQVAQKRGCSASKVWTALGNNRFLAEEYLDKHELHAMLDAAYTARREVALKSLKQEHGDRKFTDDEVEAHA